MHDIRYIEIYRNSKRATKKKFDFTWEFAYFFLDVNYACALNLMSKEEFFEMNFAKLI